MSAGCTQSRSAWPRTWPAHLPRRNRFTLWSHQRQNTTPPSNSHAFPLLFPLTLHLVPPTETPTPSPPTRRQCLTVGTADQCNANPPGPEPAPVPSSSNHFTPVSATHTLSYRVPSYHWDAPATTEIGDWRSLHEWILHFTLGASLGPFLSMLPPHPSRQHCRHHPKTPSPPLSPLYTLVSSSPDVPPPHITIPSPSFIPWAQVPPAPTWLPLRAPTLLVHHISQPQPLIVPLDGVLKPRNDVLTYPPTARPVLPCRVKVSHPPRPRPRSLPELRVLLESLAESL